MNSTIGIIIVVILLVFLYSYWRNQNWNRKLKKLSEERTPMSKDEYIEKLISEGFERRHIEVVYDELAKFTQFEHLSLYPEDDIHKLYRIEDLDDIELIDKICGRLRLKKPEQSDCDEINRQFKTTNAKYILSLTRKLQEEYGVQHRI